MIGQSSVPPLHQVYECIDAYNVFVLIAEAADLQQQEQYMKVVAKITKVSVSVHGLSFNLNF